jgi:hypothetical protein
MRLSLLSSYCHLESRTWLRDLGNKLCVNNIIFIIRLYLHSTIYGFLPLVEMTDKGSSGWINNPVL